MPFGARVWGSGCSWLGVGRCVVQCSEATSDHYHKGVCLSQVALVLYLVAAQCTGILMSAGNPLVGEGWL